MTDKSRQEAHEAQTQELQNLYAQHSQDVYRFARLALGNHPDALDVVQEVFLRAYKSLTGYRRESQPRTWLLAIARNYIFDLVRKRRTERNYIQDAVLLDTFVHRNPAESVEALMTLESLLLRLKDNYRQVFILRHIEGLSVDETATILGWTPAKVRTVNYRAAKRLKQLAQEMGKEVAEHNES